MDLITNLAITLLGAAAGAILSVALSRFTRKRRYLARDDLIGEWLSCYQRYHQVETSDQWIDEKVSIDVHGSRFRFRNRDNPLGDLYQAHATLRQGELMGEWESIRRPAGHAYGGLLLTVLPMGGLLYGYFTGPRDSGERVYGAWVLGKTEEDVSKGKALLARQTLALIEGDQGTVTGDQVRAPADVEVP